MQNSLTGFLSHSYSYNSLLKYLKFFYSSNSFLSFNLFQENKILNFEFLITLVDIFQTSLL